MKLAFFHNRISVAERAFLARQLATMIASGLTIDRAVAVLANQVSNPYLATVFGQIERDLEAGLPFSRAIAKYPTIFNRVFVNVVVAGEAVGKVSEVLQEMASRLESEQEFVSRIKGALYYPIFIFVAMGIIGAILVIKVVPQFRSVFEEAGVQLPLVTRVLIEVSSFLSHDWWLAVLLLGAAAYGFKLFLGTKTGLALSDYVFLHMPGGINQSLYMTRFTRTLSLLIQSGTPIIEALSITAEVINNNLYAVVINAAKDEVSRGVPLSVPLAKSRLFPLIVPQMVLVGEQTGRLDQVLNSLADYYEEETNTKIKALSSLFEPAMIVIVGLGVAFIVFAIFIPIYSIARF